MKQAGVRRGARVWLFAAFAAWAVAAESGGTAFSASRYLAHVKYLASDALKGRGTGSEGLDRAARYIAAEFRRLGLKAPAAGYLQEFPVTVRAKMGPENGLLAAGEGGERTLQLGKEWLPLSFSAEGKARGGVVFAGYGITAPEYGYDDYAGIDARGRFVLALRHEPREFDSRPVFAGRLYTEHAQVPSKADNAARHGAAGLLLVNDTVQHGGGDGEIEAFVPLAGPGAARIPVIEVGAAVARGWFEKAGRDFREVQEEIDRDLRPRGFRFPEDFVLTLEVDIARRTRMSRNVAGYLPGVTPEYVIAGAHYDHIGLGEQFSMAAGAAGRTHPGADDNASGTAGLLELAAWFSSRQRARRGILFVAFAGEELGLLGSSHYIRRPLLPLDRAAAMINMDMIGRMREGKVYVGGFETAPGLRRLLEERRAGTGLTLDYSDSDGYGSSDHTSFTAREVPVLFFFTGLHDDYHRPSDTWDRIDAPAAVRLLEFIGAVAEALASGEERPAFVRIKGDPEPVPAAGSPGAVP
jgi:hypothetical protein